MTASTDASSTPARISPSSSRVSTFVKPALRAAAAAYSRIADEMSVARTCPSGPTRRAAANVWPPAPAATSSTRAPARTPALSSIASVAGPSQSSSVGPQRSQASAASCHCSRVVALNFSGSKAGAGRHGCLLESA